MTLCRLCIEKGIESKHYIETLISKALTDVFQYECSFVLEEVEDKKIGLTKGLRPRISEGEDGPADDPMTSSGSGSHAIISICLKIAFILLSKDTQKLLIMDEPLPHLSTDLQERFRDFLETICEETGLQIIMVTHQPFPYGKIYKVTKRKVGNRKSSKVEVVNNELCSEDE